MSAPHLALLQINEPYCVGCGCTNSEACETSEGPCHWIVMHGSGEYGICSDCVTRPIDELLEKGMFMS